MLSYEWWRHGSSHLDQSEIWELELKSGKYSPLVREAAREVWPMWSPNSKVVFFVSDKESGENFWKVEGNKTARISHFRNCVRALAFDRCRRQIDRLRGNLGIWKFDIKTEQAQRLDIRLRGPSPIDPPDHRPLTDFSEIALSPDGKKVAVIARGDVFITPVRRGHRLARDDRTRGIAARLEPGHQGHRLCLETRREPTSLRMGLGDVCRTAADFRETGGGLIPPLLS